MSIKVHSKEVIQTLSLLTWNLHKLPSHFSMSPLLVVGCFSFPPLTCFLLLHFPSFPFIYSLLINQNFPFSIHLSLLSSTFSTMNFSLHFPSLSFNKALKLGVWSIWLSGFILICCSFYATQFLPSVVKVEFRKSSFLYPRDSVDKSDPSITIFSALTPSNGSAGKRQDLAVRSWLGLSPNINVVLFSNDPSIQSFASSFGSRVYFESDIDFSFLNVPFFHSMVARAEASSSNISVLIHPETILLQDFLSSVYHVYELDHDWFLIASSKRSYFFPFSLDNAGRQWLREDGIPISLQKLQEVLAQTWQWDYCGRRMLMAWNNKNVPLHMGVLPPFLYGKGVHNHWFVNEIYHSNYRFVFDASWTISNFHVQDSDDHEPIKSIREFTFVNHTKTNWEYSSNHQLSELYGLLSSNQANISDFVKLVKCDRQFMFTNQEQNTVYSPKHHASNSLWKGQIVQSRMQKKLSACLAEFSTSTRIMNCSVESKRSGSMPLHLPYGLEMLLLNLADENKTVVLAVAGYSYKDMLMNWVCRLRHLMINNLLVCALDDETYEFSIQQGIPVFRDLLAPRHISFNDCHFGTKCFQKVTKTKSRLVLQILKLGYNVILSDVDVYWFKNPIPLLQSFGPAVFVAQSDEYNMSVPINLPRRLNSGFYFVRSDDPSIAAMEKVVMHAMTSDLSEQPSFYDTLCGIDGANRVGDNICWEPGTNLTVQFLDRNLFPNGAYQGLWEERNVRAACAKIGCYVLHNNWISGRTKKLKRQVHSGLWDYDISSRMCLHSWQKMKVLK